MKTPEEQQLENEFDKGYKSGREDERKIIKMESELQERERNAEYERGYATGRDHEGRGKGFDDTRPETTTPGNSFSFNQFTVKGDGQTTMTIKVISTDGKEYLMPLDDYGIEYLRVQLGRMVEDNLAFLRREAAVWRHKYELLRKGDANATVRRMDAEDTLTEAQCFVAKQAREIEHLKKERDDAAEKWRLCTEDLNMLQHTCREQRSTLEHLEKELAKAQASVRELKETNESLNSAFQDRNLVIKVMTEDKERFQKVWEELDENHKRLQESYEKLRLEYNVIEKKAAEHTALENRFKQQVIDHQKLTEAYHELSLRLKHQQTSFEATKNRADKLNDELLESHKEILKLEEKIRALSCEVIVPPPPLHTPNYVKILTVDDVKAISEKVKAEVLATIADEYERKKSIQGNRLPVFTGMPPIPRKITPPEPEKSVSEIQTCTGAEN